MQAKEINWQEFRCRASSLSDFMAESASARTLTELQEKRLKELDSIEARTIKQEADRMQLIEKKEKSREVVLSSGCLNVLMDYYSWITTGKVPISRKLMYVKYIEKGKEIESESIALKSIVEGVKYNKNEIEIYNDYLQGTPDIYVGEDGIYNATKTSDIKSSWDYPGYLKKIHVPVPKSNVMQVQAYMDISGATEGEISNCLVNTPDFLKMDAYNQLLRVVRPISEESPEFLVAWEIVERSLEFDDIPDSQRVYNKIIEPFTSYEKDKIYDKVKVCRDWLYKFHEEFTKNNTK